MSFFLRIQQRHPSGPEFLIFNGKQRIASGRVNKSAIADLVALWLRNSASTRNSR
jgi:hypothetical protein